MKRFKFDNKPMVESPYPPQDTNVLWVDVDENTGKVSSISKFNNGTWKIILLKLTGDMYKIYIVRKKDISNCTYNMVDLGLPSGTLWADRNVGATSPEHYGSYFQWGDTNAYTYDGVGEVTAAKLAEVLNLLLGLSLGMEITADNVGMVLELSGMTGTDLTSTGMVFSIDKEFNWNSYFDTTDSGSTFNKYNFDGGLTVLESSDDAAYIHMGSQYKMPTIEQYTELINETNVTNILHDDNGNEYVVTFDDSTTGHKNLYTINPELPEGIDIYSLKLDRTIFTNKNDSSKSISFITNGFTESTIISQMQDSKGSYWSSSLSDNDTADLVEMASSYMKDDFDFRCIGCGIRGVQS